MGRSQYPVDGKTGLTETNVAAIIDTIGRKDMKSNQHMILFVCSQGRIRSRTAEILAVRGGLDARSCGTDADAVVPINDHLIRLADVVVCMEEHHAAAVREFMHAEGKEIHVLGIEDVYEPFAKALVAALVASIEGPLPDVAAIISKRIDPILARPSGEMA